VVARTHGSAIFLPDESFSLNCTSSNGESFTLRFATSYHDEGFDVPVPRNFWVEARGPAPNLDSAVELFGNTALEISALIALAANASMGFLEVELAFDVTPELDEHDFLQSFLPDSPRNLVPGRRIDMEVLEAIVRALTNHPERDRLNRATTQYVEALSSWRLGYEITCLAHLYMGVEAVTKAVFREYLRKMDKSEHKIVEEWGISNSDKLKRRKEIEGQARRRLVFQGDAECARKARSVSDGFEHGFSDFGKMRKPARETIVQTAEYLRRAILETLGIEKKLLDRALSEDYRGPRGPLALVRYLRGTLTGHPEQLAAEGELYPIMNWRSSLRTIQIGENGKYSFRPNETLTGKFGAGVQLKIRRFEVWDGCSITAPSPEPSPGAGNIGIDGSIA